jgi:hypothetical protein
MILLLLWASDAAAQAPTDAGAAHVRAPSEGLSPALGDRAERRTLPSPFFPKRIGNPGILSEKVRARLEERVRSRAAEDGVPPPLPLAGTDTLPPEDAVIHAEPPSGDTLRRRMISFETDEGVTILSNRRADLQSPAPAPLPSAPVVTRQSAEEPVPERSEATETRSLRARRAPPPRRKETSTSWGWIALVAGGAGGLGFWWLKRGRSRLPGEPGNRVR